LATTLSHALRFQQKRGVIENFEYLGEFVEYFRNCWLYCVLYLLVTGDAKKSLKTDYENLVNFCDKGAGEIFANIYDKNLLFFTKISR
jgi:hypothetical protein